MAKKTLMRTHSVRVMPKDIYSRSISGTEESTDE